MNLLIFKGTATPLQLQNIYVNELLSLCRILTHIFKCIAWRHGQQSHLHTRQTPLSFCLTVLSWFLAPATSSRVNHNPHLSLLVTLACPLTHFRKDTFCWMLTNPLEIWKQVQQWSSGANKEWPDFSQIPSKKKGKRSIITELFIRYWMLFQIFVFVLNVFYKQDLTRNFSYSVIQWLNSFWPKRGHFFWACGAGRACQSREWCHKYKMPQ